MLVLDMTANKKRVLVCMSTRRTQPQPNKNCLSIQKQWQIKWPSKALFMPKRQSKHFQIELKWLHFILHCHLNCILLHNGRPICDETQGIWKCHSIWGTRNILNCTENLGQRKKTAIVTLCKYLSKCIGHCLGNGILWMSFVKLYF